MKIIIATDGSEHSRTAVEECAALLGGRPDLEIRVVAAFAATIPTDAFAPSAQYAEENTRYAQAAAEAAAAETARLVRERLPQAVVEETVGMDFPDRFIVETARNWPADLIVVGSHGRGFWGRLTLGSVSDGVVHHAPCTVLIGRRKEAL